MPLRSSGGQPAPIITGSGPPGETGTALPITYRGTGTTVQSDVGTTRTVSPAVGVVTGDFMLAQIWVNGTPTITPPAGWTQIGTGFGGANPFRLFTYYKFRGAGESSYVFTESGGYTWWAVTIHAWGNVSATGTIQTLGSASSIGTSTSITAPSVTTVDDNELVVAVVQIGGISNIYTSPPAGWTQRSTTGHSVYELTMTSPGASGVLSLSMDVAQYWATAVIALRPARSGGTVGVDGQMYLDYVNNALYGPRAGGWDLSHFTSIASSQVVVTAADPTTLDLPAGTTVYQTDDGTAAGSLLSIAVVSPTLV